MANALRIDIQSVGGSNLGSGPITTAYAWTYTNRLDRAGDFSFQVPLADPQYSYLAPRVLVRAWQLIDGVMTQLGLGIVDSIQENSVASPSMATVSGGNLMRELTYRSVKSLLIAETGYVSPEDVHFLELDSSGSGAEASPNLYATMTNWFDGNLTTHSLVGDGLYDWYYIGYSRVYSEVKFNIHTVRTLGGNTTKVQYFNGTGWITLTAGANSFADGTAGVDNSFEQNGSWTFTPPTDWISMIQNCRATGAADNNRNEYWLRFNNHAGTGVDLNEITIKTEVATLTGAQLIMALAPAGWSLVGYSTTLTSAYLQLGDETILDALIALGNLAGEHFRLGGTGTARQLGWIRTDASDSGIIAWRNIDPSTVLTQPAACLISEIHRTFDSYQMVSRIIPYGAGSGSARLTLKSTTRTAPAGYTLSAANNYLRYDATETAYGQIESAQTFSTIGPSTSGLADVVAAADSLFDAALYWLSTHTAGVDTYALTVYGLTGILDPGDTVHIVWLEVVNGVAIRNIDLNLIILEVATTANADGTRSAALVVSNQPRWPLSEADALAKLQGTVQAMHSITQAVSINAIQATNAAVRASQTAASSGGINYT